MAVDYLEIFVEEPSMEAVLRALLPRWIAGIEFAIYTYNGKLDLLDKLPNRLRAYSHFLPQTTRILVLVDRDDDDCLLLKTTLEQHASSSGLMTKTASVNSHYSVLNRIVVEELEAWYFGDWLAVREAYPRIDPHIPQRAAFRFPDQISGGTWEAFERIAQKAGYFKGGLRKVEAASVLGSLMDPARNNSPSFISLRDAVESLIYED